MVISDYMAKTMIQISTDVRDKIKSLGKMGETYNDVLGRLYSYGIEVQMAQLFLDTTGYVNLKDVMKERKLGNHLH